MLVLKWSYAHRGIQAQEQAVLNGQQHVMNWINEERVEASVESAMASIAK